MLNSILNRCPTGDFGFLLGMEKNRAADLLEEAKIDFSFVEMRLPWAESGVFRVIKQEMVNGSLLLTISLFDILDESGAEDE